MTTDQTAAPDADTYEVAEGALQFAAPEPAPGVDPPGTRTPFQIVGDSTVLWAVKPKQGVLLHMGSTIAALEESDDVTLAMSAYNDFMDAVLAPETREFLEARFRDTQHAWDLPVLDPIMKGLVGHWFAGPTGGRPASAPSPSGTGRRSTGRARSTGRTRKP